MTVGYRVGEPAETNAKKVIEFEVVESGNEPMLDYLAAALKCEPTLQSINKALDAQFGSDAIGMWLTDTPNLAEKHYGPGEPYEVKIPPGAIVGVDLGEDGKLWIWRQQGNPTVFVEIRMLKDAPPITGSDMKTYGPFREKRVYAIPKANARVFIKHGIAKATRKEAGKPTLKEMFKGEVLTPYIEAAVAKPLVEETKLKSEETGKLADVFLELLTKAGVSLPSRFKGEFEEAMDINKSYEENVKLIEAAAKRIILMEKTERVLGEIREARGA